MCKKPDKNETVAGRSPSSEGGYNAVGNGDNSNAALSASNLKAEGVTPTHSAHKRNTDYDWLIFLGPALLYKLTPVWPIYAIALTRILISHVILSLHYQFIDKDNYKNKLTQKQIKREKDEYLTAFLLHMYVQVGLQIVFPSMFFSDYSVVGDCAKEVLLGHILMVEPLYYFVHRWLHTPKHMKAMHGFHHLSINTLPTTSLVQNFEEHFVYIATFGPAFLVPFFLYGRQHWLAIGLYLVTFDIVNAWGHTNIRIRNKLWTGKYSPLKYLIYTPEFHLGHHAYFNANYTLFMPIWDYLFGTAREYQKKDPGLLPAKQQDFVFIGHNGGLGHLFTIPEFCLYNVYDEYKLTPLPVKLEFFIMHVIGVITSTFFATFYYCSRFCIANDYIGRIIVLCRTPWDYMSPKSYKSINNDIVKLMRQEHKRSGTRYFGLGNLNKMKQLNEGGIEIARLVKEDPYLKDKRIRVWTGDTMTVASLVHQVMDIPNLKEMYYIGAGGKVGTAVCEILVRERPDLKIRIFSRHHYLKHKNISYSCDLSEMANYRICLVGKILSDKMYSKALSGLDAGAMKTRFVLDYTVPALPIPTFSNRPERIQHIRVGLLKTYPNNPFLKGHYDLCMSTDENHIVPCHFGCILQTVLGREEDEVGEIDQTKVEQLWKMAVSLEFENLTIDYEDDGSIYSADDKKSI